MFGRIVLVVSLMFAGCVAVPAAQAKPPKDQQAFLAACTDWDEWDKPAPPFRIHGDTWYVGTCGISVILVTGKKGHILIDSGTEAGAQIVLRNIAKLGFDPQDVRYLLHSHEHFDHVGGMNILRAATGAWLVPSEIAAQVLKTGKPDTNDPQAAHLPDMAPVEVYQTISDGGTIQLGDLLLTSIATPGHSPGGLTWQWESCAKSTCATVVYADSLSPVSADGYRFSDHPEYLAAYRASIDRVADLTCGLLLTPHPTASNMLNRMKSGSLQGVDQCIDYADGLSKRLDERLAKEEGVE